MSASAPAGSSSSSAPGAAAPPGGSAAAGGGPAPAAGASSGVDGSTSSSATRGGRGGRGSRGGRGGRPSAAAAATAAVTDQIEALESRLRQQLQITIDDRLRTYHETAQSFVVQSGVVNLENLRPASINQDKVVIAVNALQLDEIQEALRAHRALKEEVKTTKAAFAIIEARITALETELAELKAGASRRRPRSDGSSSHSDDPDRTLVEDARKKPSRKRSRVGTGRPDAAVQKAFTALLREGFGISEDEPWPEYPDVPRTSPSWPRHPVDLDGEDQRNDPDAHIDPQLRENPPLGQPKDRLDWIEGRMDDPAFKAVLAKHARTIFERPDDFELKQDEESRQYSRILDACKRSLLNLKHRQRERIQKSAEELEAKEREKHLRDRRRSRRTTRWNNRQAAAEAHPDEFGPAVKDMINQYLVEDDETEDEGYVDEFERVIKRIREAVPEFHSQENRTVQQRLDRLVPSSSSGYPLLPANWLHPHRSALHSSIPRIAVSRAFAEQHPGLVRNLKLNPPPYKPAPGAIAADAEEYGRPIRGLTLRAVVEQHEAAEGETGAEGSGAGADADQLGRSAGGGNANTGLGGGDDPEAEDFDYSF